MTDEQSDAQQTDVPTCYRHPTRETYIRCQRCNRNICPDCQRQASVGFHCVECVQEGAKSMRTPRTRLGGVLRPGGAVVTWVILGLNVAVFLAIFIGQFNLLYEMTALRGLEVAFGEYWRLLTTAFVQTHPFHLLINMFTLFVLGPPLEAVLGRLRFTGLYLISGLAGSALAYALTPPNVIIIGASGALSGLFGATLLLARRLQWDITWLVAILGINVVLNLMNSQLSWQAHLGGLVGGVLLGAALGYAPEKNRNLVQGAAAAGVVVISVALILWRTLSLTS